MKQQHGKIILVGSAVLALCLIVGFVAFISTGPPHFKVYVHAQLDSIRTRKRHQLVGYFHKLHRTALSIRQDKLMVQAFHRIRAQNRPVSKKLDYQIDHRYAYHYLQFYDILFVDHTGRVFHSVRRESDYGHNLFQGEFANTKLAQTLRTCTKACFVDYQIYQPSREAAAFFVIPFTPGNPGGGWFVLQVSANRLNTIMIQHQDTARTSESYLLNQQRYMLNDSRFYRDSTILRLQVNSAAAQQAIQSKSTGHLRAPDYRGVPVYSSFETLNILGVTWVLLTEIDASEAYTRYYKQYRPCLQEHIRTRIEADTPYQTTPPQLSGKRIRIDTDEYSRGAVGDLLRTYGVATCTAIAVTFGSNFSYLAHLAPIDVVYGGGLFDNRTRDLLSHLFHNIRHYDIRPTQLDQLHFYLIAPRPTAFEPIIDRILDAGLNITNITPVTCPAALSAVVSVPVSQGKVYIEWRRGSSSLYEDATQRPGLEKIVQEILKKLKLARKE